MDIKEIVGLNTKYYRYKKGLTQEDFAKVTNLRWLILVSLRMVLLI